VCATPAKPAVVKTTGVMRMRNILEGRMANIITKSKRTMSSIHHIFAQSEDRNNPEAKGHPELKNMDANKICLCKKCHRELEVEIRKYRIRDDQRLLHLVDFIRRKQETKTTAYNVPKEVAQFGGIVSTEIG